MKVYRNLLLFILLHAAAPATSQSVKQDFARLNQLEGTWQIEHSRQYEYWHQTDSNTLAGMGYTLHKADTVINERLELKLSAGNMAYIATVTRQNDGKPVSFAYKGQKEAGYIFENTEHDFPQTIVYRFDSDIKLGVVLTGEDRQGKKIVRFNMYRVKK